jgi:hypothetical protein
VSCNIRVFPSKQLIIVSGESFDLSRISGQHFIIYISGSNIGRSLVRMGDYSIFGRPPRNFDARGNRSHQGIAGIYFSGAGRRLLPGPVYRTAQNQSLLADQISIPERDFSFGKRHGVFRSYIL